jgi:hypothetical protein
MNLIETSREEGYYTDYFSGLYFDQHGGKLYIRVMGHRAPFTGIGVYDSSGWLGFGGRRFVAPHNRAIFTSIEEAYAFCCDLAGHKPKTPEEREAELREAGW